MHINFKYVGQKSRETKLIKSIFIDHPRFTRFESRLNESFLLHLTSNPKSLDKNKVRPKLDLVKKFYWLILLEIMYKTDVYTCILLVDPNLPQIQNSGLIKSELE